MENDTLIQVLLISTLIIRLATFYQSFQFSSLDCFDCLPDRMNPCRKHSIVDTTEIYSPIPRLVLGSLLFKNKKNYYRVFSGNEMQAQSSNYFPTPHFCVSNFCMINNEM